LALKGELSSVFTRLLCAIPEALRPDGWTVNRKPVRSMKGIEAIYQAANTSRPHPDHKI
jgi:hypothetical protein